MVIILKQKWKKIWLQELKKLMAISYSVGKLLELEGNMKEDMLLLNEINSYI